MNARKTIRLAATASVTALLALTGCASAPPVGLDLPQASAVEETVRADMPVDPADNGLTWAQIALLENIASEYKARGYGPLVISYPQGGNNEDAAIGAIAEARTILYGHGLDWRDISGGHYDARGVRNAAVVFSFRRYRAVAPECDGWDDLTDQFDNRHDRRFGCAMAANLAAMAADPRDLVAPRGSDPADVGRRQTVIDRYRAGQSTASETSDRESGAVSNVSN